MHLNGLFVSKVWSGASTTLTTSSQLYPKLSQVPRIPLTYQDSMCSPGIPIEVGEGRRTSMHHRVLRRSTGHTTTRSEIARGERPIVTHTSWAMVPETSMQEKGDALPNALPYWQAGKCMQRGASWTTLLASDDRPHNEDWKTGPLDSPHSRVQGRSGVVAAFLPAWNQCCLMQM